MKGHQKATEQAVCLWCGTTWVDGAETSPCPKRENERAPHVSVFSDLSAIGERMKAIMDEEAKARSA